ncbi:TPA: hypothetical protein VJS59_001629 [Streptococcus pyogenes]|uniref:hypothetical protein n=1 Tax=unclassified Peribacillus TaxID=2675266 RepID=UPI002B3A0415|nr:hypothetical protein [Streptococcus pyogenes]HER2169470.1 hypothetical protein [Streptococcus pyogenes]HER2174409.1 hypothetical protein [Streptococcus pyogenes]
MNYVEAVKATLEAELKKAGFVTSGQMGAHDVYVKVFVEELDKLNKRLEALEQA